MDLREYQKKQLAFHLGRDRSINTSAPSTGKTPTMCSWIKLRNVIDGCKTIFVMPSSLMFKNREDMLTWTGWDEDEVQICTGTPQKRRKIYEDKNVKCFITTFDTFANEWEMIKDLQPDLNAVCVDEVHLGFSSHSSKRTQSLYRSSRRLKHFLFCSGTVIDGRYSSLYPMLAVIEPRYYGSYNNFLKMHGVFNTFGQVVSWKNGERLKAILDQVSVGISLKQAYPNRFDNILINETCELDSNVREAYKDLEEDALLELQDEYLECDNPMVKAIRCRSLLSQPETFDLIHKPKINGKDEVIKTHVENALLENKRILIFACFREEQNRIAKVCESLGARVGVINGSVSGLKRGEIDYKFREHDLDVVVGTPSTMSVGFNMEYVKEIIFASLDYKNSNFYQGLLRGNRGSRQEPLPAYILTYNTKIEKRIMQIIMRKEKEKEKVFN